MQRLKQENKTIMTSKVITDMTFIKKKKKVQVGFEPGLPAK
jgi:hypothetical protein